MASVFNLLGPLLFGAAVANTVGKLIDLPGDNAWPIVSTTLIELPKDSKDPARSANVLKFFDWAYKNGDPIAQQLAYVPLPDAVKDAVRLGCVAIGYTIYPGSAARNQQYENLKDLAEEAKAHGLAVVTWSYPRGEGITDKKGETAVDVAGYAAQIACQLGTHVVKVKPPGDFVYQPEAQKVFEKYSIPWKTLADRVRHVVQSAFNGKRIVIFSGGEAKGDDEIRAEATELAKGGAFGAIVGRNAFQRPKDQAIKLLRDLQEINRKS